MTVLGLRISCMQDLETSETEDLGYMSMGESRGAA